MFSHLPQEPCPRTVSQTGTLTGLHPVQTPARSAGCPSPEAPPEVYLKTLESLLASPGEHVTSR